MHRCKSCCDAPLHLTIPQMSGVPVVYSPSHRTWAFPNLPVGLVSPFLPTQNLDRTSTSLTQTPSPSLFLNLFPSGSPGWGRPGYPGQSPSFGPGPPGGAQGGPRPGGPPGPGYPGYGHPSYGRPSPMYGDRGPPGPQGPPRPGQTGAGQYRPLSGPGPQRQVSNFIFRWPTAM